MDLPKKAVEVRTKRLLLRPLRMEDAADVHLLRSYPEGMKFTSHPPDKSVEQTAEAMQKWVADGRYNFAVELLDDTEIFGDQVNKPKLVGCVGMVRPAEIGYAFNHHLWGKGYGYEAIQALVTILWDHLSQLGGSDFIKAYVDVDNIGSIRLLKKVGFKEVDFIKGDYTSAALGLRDAYAFRIDRPKAS